MKKVSKLSIIAIAIIVVVGVVYYYENIREVEVEIPQTPVVVAKEFIPENTVIEADMITLDKRYTNDLLKEQKYITSHIDKVEGKRTKVPIYPNETIKLNRVLDNEPYMGSENVDKKQISFQLSNTDKALDIKKGNYIDIWIEPTEDGIELNETTQILFEKLKVVEIDNKVHQNITNVKKEENSQKDKDVKIPAYITIELTDTDIQAIYNIDESIFNFRVSLYGQEKFYKVVSEVIEKQKVEIDEDIIENQENGNQ